MAGKQMSQAEIMALVAQAVQSAMGQAPAPNVVQLPPPPITAPTIGMAETMANALPQAAVSAVAAVAPPKPRSNFIKDASTEAAISFYQTKGGGITGRIEFDASNAAPSGTGKSITMYSHGGWQYMGSPESKMNRNENGKLGIENAARWTDPNTRKAYAIKANVTISLIEIQ